MPKIITLPSALLALLVIAASAKQQCCTEDSRGTATKYDSKESIKAQGYLDGWGLLARSPDFFGKQRVKPAAFLSSKIKSPNVLYPSAAGTDPMCGNAVANGQTSVCENHVWDGGNIDKTCKPGTVPWNLATVAAGMYKDDNEGNDPWKGTVTTYANGKVFCEGYYPTDANSIDQRNTANGLGLHPSQDHACFGDVCITGYDTSGESVGKCNYDAVSPDDFGSHLGNSIRDKNGESMCRDGGRSPNFEVDFVSCWYVNPWQAVAAQNSIWSHRASWLNNLLPTIDGKGNEDNDQAYWGWNEAPCTTTDGSDLDDIQNMDVVIIKLPPTVDSDEASACMLSDEADNKLANQLMDFWRKGAGVKPIVWMSEHKSAGSADYDKKFFAQNFLFKDRSCITVDDNGDGPYYYPAWDMKCTAYADYVDKYWGDHCNKVGASFESTFGSANGSASVGNKTA